eukprot:gene20560-24692_t
MTRGEGSCRGNAAPGRLAGLAAVHGPAIIISRKNIIRIKQCENRILTFWRGIWRFAAMPVAPAASRARRRGTCSRMFHFVMNETPSLIRV